MSDENIGYSAGSNEEHIQVLQGRVQALEILVMHMARMLGHQQNGQAACEVLARGLRAEVEGYRRAPVLMVKATGAHLQMLAGHFENEAKR